MQIDITMKEDRKTERQTDRKKERKKEESIKYFFFKEDL